MNIQAYSERFPDLTEILDRADHVDVKTISGAATMREFIAAMFSYQPAWITFLYHVRGGFVRLLGMRQDGVPRAMRLQAEQIPMTPGSAASFFTVRMALEDRYWVAEVRDSHLRAALGVVVEPLSGDQRRFHVLTVVHYRNWAGPLYFTVIRPFHHLVVTQMARAGVGRA